MDKESLPESPNEFYLINGDSINRIYYSPTEEHYLLQTDGLNLFLVNTPTVSESKKSNLERNLELRAAEDKIGFSIDGESLIYRTLIERKQIGKTEYQDEEGEINLYNIKTQEITPIYTKESKDFKINPKNNYIACIGPQGKVTLVNITSGTEIETPSFTEESEIVSSFFSPEGNYFVVTTVNSKVIISKFIKPITEDIKKLNSKQKLYLIYHQMTQGAASDNYREIYYSLPEKVKAYIKPLSNLSWKGWAAYKYNQYKKPIWGVGLVGVATGAYYAGKYYFAKKSNREGK